MDTLETQGNATLIPVPRTNSTGDALRGFLKVSSESISLDFWVVGGIERTAGLSFNFTFCFFEWEMYSSCTKFRRDYAENKSSSCLLPSDSPRAQISASEATSVLCIFPRLVIAYVSNMWTYIFSSFLKDANGNKLYILFRTLFLFFI